ncbi:interactor of HORMAD1 protein 1 [Triplophysa rosa]|uniref:Coiled-coil domain-containing protein 36 n=1 Tax=Triplophysa rosa TaxID=992332 RepID=A0A9W7WT08_TRIRA|nr:interactor of HORMAD1 protein 1 [Triplophysa rosa]KAI7807710.1 putative coiled-coil domain-containing protein 36 [Triplophysa rosa]
MKPNVWNINELLNIPASSGGIKTGKGPGSNDFSRLTDSQILLSSQFWPESSHSFSQDMSGQSGGSQKNSQEVKKTTVSSSYSSKPFLFDGKFPNFTGGKAAGTLDRFVEEKRNATEKHERENLTRGILQLQDSLESIETLLNRIEGSNDTTRKVLLEKMDNFSKTIEDFLNNVREGITCQFETMQSQTQIVMEDREAKISLATKDLNSNILTLHGDLEHLKVVQGKDQGMLGEILSQLGTLIAIHNPTAAPSPARMIDSEVQTSPGLLERFCVMSAEKHEALMLCPLKTPKAQNKNTHVLPVQGQQQVKQTEVRSKLFRTIPLVDAQSISSLEDPRNEYLDRPLVHIEPEKPLHAIENIQRMSTDALPPPKILRRRQKAVNYRGKKRALVLPQRQSTRQKGALKLDSQQNEDLKGEQIDSAPPSSVCESWKMTNKSVAENNLKPQPQATVAPVSMCEADRPLNPFSIWSQDTNNSQMIVEYKMTKWETMVPEVSVTDGEDGLWQLFDLNNDSE